MNTHKMSPKVILGGFIAIVIFITTVILTISCTVRLNILRGDIQKATAQIEQLTNQVNIMAEEVLKMNEDLEMITPSDTTISDVTDTDNETHSDIIHTVYTVKVTSDVGLNVREDADITSDVLRVLPYGMEIDVNDSESTDSWLKLATAPGYVYKEYTTTNYASESAPNDTVPNTVEAKTTPTAESSSSQEITVPSGFTAEQFNDIISAYSEKRGIMNSVLLNQGEALVELENTYGFNALFALSVSGLESGFGITSAARNKNNPFGLMTRDGIMSFDSVHECIMYFGGNLERGYISQGRTTIQAIANKYNPGNPSGWTDDVTWFWNSICKII